MDENKLYEVLGRYAFDLLVLRQQQTVLQSQVAAVSADNAGLLGALKNLREQMDATPARNGSVSEGQPVVD